MPAIACGAKQAERRRTGEQPIDSASLDFGALFEVGFAPSLVGAVFKQQRVEEQTSPVRSERPIAYAQSA
jgi:hypothetical protein